MGSEDSALCLGQEPAALTQGSDKSYSRPREDSILQEWGLLETWAGSLPCPVTRSLLGGAGTRGDK